MGSVLLPWFLAIAGIALVVAVLRRPGRRPAASPASGGPPKPRRPWLSQPRSPGDRGEVKVIGKYVRPEDRVRSAAVERTAVPGGAAPPAAGPAQAPTERRPRFDEGPAEEPEPDG